MFLVINWSALSQDMTVNLVYQEIQAPLGVIVAAAFGIVVVLQAFYNLWQQASVVVELRQAHKEARNARAEAAEADKTVSMSLLEKSVKVLPGWRRTRHAAARSNGKAGFEKKKAISMTVLQQCCAIKSRPSRMPPQSAVSKRLWKSKKGLKRTSCRAWRSEG